MVLQSAWDTLEPNTGQDEDMARCTDFTTLQEGAMTMIHVTHLVMKKKGNPLTKLYTKVAKRVGMTNSEYMHMYKELEQRTMSHCNV